MPIIDIHLTSGIMEISFNTLALAQIKTAGILPVVNINGENIAIFSGYICKKADGTYTKILNDFSAKSINRYDSTSDAIKNAYGVSLGLIFGIRSEPKDISIEINTSAGKKSAIVYAPIQYYGHTILVVKSDIFLNFVENYDKLLRHVQKSGLPTSAGVVKVSSLINALGEIGPQTKKISLDGTDMVLSARMTMFMKNSEFQAQLKKL